MLTVEQALAEILSRVSRLPAERVGLADLPGRTLAEDVTAQDDSPPFANSAVDGYAVRTEDVRHADLERPVVLRLTGEVPAGVTPKQEIVPGTTARIMTGAVVPPGADAIVMQEDTTPAGPDRVSVHEAPTEGQHIRSVGCDVRAGQTVLRAGISLHAGEIAMMATVGRLEAEVFRRSRVAILSTGDEVVEIVPGAPAPPGKIRNTNRYTLAALAQEAGALLHSVTHVSDSPQALEEAFRRCAHPATGADVIVVAGGVSVGDRDYVRPVLERLGRLDLWRVAMKPGKPLAFGCIGEALFFGLPGNPVSAMVTFELFARPALAKQMGRPEQALLRPAVQAVLTDAIAHTAGRQEYVRAITTVRDGRFYTRPTGMQGSSLIHSMVGANSLAVIPAHANDVASGSQVTVLLLDSFLSP